MYGANFILRWFVVFCSFFTMICGWPFHCEAARIRWKNIPFKHYAENEEIKDFLSNFFSYQGLGVVCSQKVKGKVSGNFIEKNPKSFYDAFERSYNLVSYYDGAKIFVYRSSEITSRLLNPNYLDIAAFKNTLNKLDIFDNRYGLKIVDKDRIIFVSGPERYVDLVNEVAEKMDAKAMANKGQDDIVKVFPLKYAWADDKTVKFREKETVIPGVATILNNIITGKIQPKLVFNPNYKGIKSTATELTDGLSGLRERNGRRNNGKSLRKIKRIDNEELMVDTPDMRNSQPQDKAWEAGVVQADARQNAVIVRDEVAKMPYYKKIISLLDVCVGLIEIRVSIIDVNRDDIENLGVEWNFQTSHDPAFQGVLNGSGYLNSGGLDLPVPSPGVNIATIVGDSRDFFMSRVHALQNVGKADILSEPSVLTMDNMEAQLEHSKTVHVRVAGKEDVDLFDITAGVVMRVTPHIITRDEKVGVKLVIQIEDGDFVYSDENVDGIPVVTKSHINTQAVVVRNQSLLIGGYKKERKLENGAHVPFLSKIPVIGWLFKNNEKVDSNSERLFLITPTIVPYGG